MEHDKDIPKEILQETRRLIDDLLKNPEFAEKAISDRNIIIRGLKADINHRKVAFKEIEGRYDIISDENIKLQEHLNALNENVKALQNAITVKDEEIKKIKQELDKEKAYGQDSFSVRIEKVIDKLPPSNFSSVLRFLLTGPVAKFTILTIFCLLLTASIVGWGFVATALEPIFKLVKLVIGD